MTKLSMFLWLADSVNSFAGLFGVTAAVIFTGLFFYMMAKDEFDLELPSWAVVLLLIFGFTSAAICCIIPEKKTLYMIAGVELANTVAHTEEFGKVKTYLGDTGVEMINDIKSIIHAEAEEAIEKIKEKKDASK